MNRAKPDSGGGHRPISNPIPGLEAQIRVWASQLKRAYPNLWGAAPLTLRDQAVAFLRSSLTPRNRLSGARRTLAVDTAYRMWRDQLRQHRRGRRPRVSWLRIARACIDGFRYMDDAERKLKLRRLQNAVYNRSHRAWKRLERRRGRRVDAHNEVAEPSA
jgi:hypothetical protein